MKVVLFLGEMAVGPHGTIDPERLYDGRALTGSESHLLNLARGLAEKGHDVAVFGPSKGFINKDRVWYVPADTAIPEADAYVSVSEPDLLRKVPAHKFRVNLHQLGDFYMSQPQFEHYVDAFAFVSPNSMKQALTHFPQVPRTKSVWLPNSINSEFYKHDVARKPHTAAWLSSPDRGLHRLLEIWPHIRRQISDAELRIYYRFEPWYAAVKDQQSPFGERARYMRKALDILGSKGEHGVYLMDAVPPTVLMKDLCQTQVVPYTFDPIAYTETFCIALMDACAAGCVPICSDIDAIGDIYKGIAHIIPGRPQASHETWIKTIVRAMTDDDWADEIRTRAQTWSASFRREKVAALWEKFLLANIGRRDPIIDTTMLPETIDKYVRETSGESAWGTLSDKAPLSGASASMNLSSLMKHNEEIASNTMKVTTTVIDAMATTIEKARSNRPAVSILVMLSRPGGIDITFAALRDQTFKDFEVILVDNRYEKRHDAIMKMAKRYGLKNVIHIPEHRRNGKWIVACSAFNTAIMAARGKYVLILHDFTYAPPGWIESHLNNQKDKRLVIGNHQNVDMPELEKPIPNSDETDRPCLDPDQAFEGQNELCIFKRGVFDPSWLPMPIGPKQWQPGYAAMWKSGAKPDRSWITLTNDSIDREFLWDLGGIDERFDFGRGPFDINLGIRIAEAGGDVVWVDEPNVPILNPRFAFRTKPYGDPNKPFEGRWSKSDAYVYEQHVEARHEKVANNPYDMRQLAHDMQLWRLPDATCIPREISDSEYWGGTIKPETSPRPPITHPPLTAKINGKITLCPTGPDFADQIYMATHGGVTGLTGLPTIDKAPALITKRPTVSILVPAYRPGGIDVTFAAMRDQRFRDFEIVIVDRRYEHRHDRVMQAARKYDLNVIHTPEHRRNGPWITAATAYNTAAALAAGEKIVFLHEWWYAPPGWIEAHLNLLANHPQGISLTGYTTREPPTLATKKPFSFETGRELVWDSAKDHTSVLDEDEVLRGEVLDEIYAFQDGPFDPSWIPNLRTIKEVAYRPNDNWQQDCRPDIWKQGGRPTHSWSIMCNDGMHRDWFMRLGGHDEMMDKTKGLFDVEFSSRAKKAGGEFLWNPDITCVSIRPQKISRTRPCGGMNERIGTRWSNADGETYYNKQKESPRTRAKNPIDILDVARRMEHWRRQGAKRIPIDIPDEAYWGRDPLWPEDLSEEWFKDD